MDYWKWKWYQTGGEVTKKSVWLTQAREAESRELPGVKRSTPRDFHWREARPSRIKKSCKDFLGTDEEESQRKTARKKTKKKKKEEEVRQEDQDEENRQEETGEEAGWWHEEAGWCYEGGTEDAERSRLVA